MSLRARRLIFGANPQRTIVRIAVLAVIAFVTFTWVLIPVRAEGVSMLPTLQSGSFHLVNRLAFMRTPPRRGDIVGLEFSGPHVLYIKRVIGLPGERVSIVRGVLFVDGKRVDEPYVKNRAPWEVAEVRLAADEYFLVGDNRGMPADEHDFGRAPLRRIVGRVVF